jgi:hypothetical protein
MNVKSGCEKAEARRRRDAALRRQTHMNMSNTPFTNTKTCSGELAEDNTRRRAYDYAYGVILCHSTYRKLIDGGYVVRF